MDMKEYMAPEMEVIELKYQAMLCVSGDSGSTDTPEVPTEPGGHEPNW